MQAFLSSPEALAAAADLYRIDDPEWRAAAERCRAAVAEDPGLCRALARLRASLCEEGQAAYSALWRRQGERGLPDLSAPPFTSNLLLLSGWETHRRNMDRRRLDPAQRERQIFRVRQQLVMCGLRPIAFVAVLWGYQFTNLYIAELGRLQFEFKNADGQAPENVFSVHVPPEGRLEPAAVDASFSAAGTELPRIFGAAPDRIVCTSWLLSPQILSLCRPGSNMAAFGSRFSVEERPDSCRNEVLGYLFHARADAPLDALAEDTSLQRTVKAWLLAGNDPKLGFGTLKK